MSIDLGTTVVVEVVSPSPVFTYNPPTGPVVTIVPIAGPKGDAGAAGGARLVYTQASASASWLIPHTLPHYPQVQILDTSLAVVDADVQVVDDTHVSVIFAAPTSGYAVLT